VIYSFCSRGGPQCTDGWLPQGNLTMDTSGDLFGATLVGGANGKGVAFELIPSADKSHWTEKVLYSFCARTNCADGQSPAGRLLLDRSGTLYGLTQSGGNATDGGVAFALVPPKAGTTPWKLSVLYSFCAQRTCPDGIRPVAGMVADASGNLYGQTTVGCASFHGTVFELIPNAEKSHWSEKVLYSFCAQTNCADGYSPNGVFRDASGNLFGTTNYGGINFGLGPGVAFELKP
jgi:hypothetical protein